MLDRRPQEQGDCASWMWVKGNIEQCPNSMTTKRALLMKEEIIHPAIDIGCNTGGFTIFCDCYVGVDFVKKHLIQLRRDKKEIEAVCASSEYLPFRDKTFGTVILGEVIEHVEKPESLLNETSRIGRHIVLTTPLAETNKLEWIGAHHQLFRKEEILGLLSKYINISFYKILDEGEGTPQDIFIRGKVR